MSSRFRIIVINLFFAVGYFLGGYLGTLLAAPPSNASPIWPASGVALAAILLYGYRILPGVFIGALAAQVYAFLDISTVDKTLDSLLIGSVVALASCLQAIFGTFLIKRFVGIHDPLIEDKKILRFLILGGPVSCIVSATIGISVLYFRDIIVPDDFVASWGIWWVGDVIGVLIFTPVVLLFSSKSESFWKSRRTFVVYPLLILLCIVIWLFKYSQQLEQDRLASQFQHQVTMVHEALQNRIVKLFEINLTIKTFLENSTVITDKEFHDISQPFITRNNSILALEWIPRVSVNEREQLEKSVNFIIRETDEHGNLIPANQRPAYFPVYFIEPRELKSQITGFDIYANSRIRSVINRAIDSRQTQSISGRQLLQNISDRGYFVIYSPVYQKDRPIQTVAQRRKYFRGLVASIYPISEVVQTVLKQLPNVELLLNIKKGKQPLYSSVPEVKRHALKFINLEEILEIKLAGYNWEITYQPSAVFYARQKSWSTWWLLLGGLLLTGLVGLGLMLMTGRSARVEELVKIKTKALKYANLKLSQEMAKRHKLQIEQAGRNKVLEKLAKGDSLDSILHCIAVNAERQQPQMLCSILLLDTDKKQLHNGASPSLPTFYVEAIDGTIVADGVGSCGTAAYRKETVIVEDILAHPFWRNVKDLVLKTDLRACWSEPIISSQNTVLGTFANYYRQPCAPAREDLLFIQKAAQLCAIAIERKNNESELRIAATTFQSHEAILVADSAGIILRVNDAFTVITGYTEEEVVGQSPKILSSSYHDREFYRDLYKALVQYGWWEGEIWNRRKNGEFFPEWLKATAIKNKQNEITHYVAIFSDITDKKAAEKEIHNLAFYDPLTGLPNRRFLLDKLKYEIASAKRHQRYGALFFLDLDHFKRLNDSLGHQVGDELLVQVALRIKALLREEDTACRLGGDEFIVLVSGEADSLRNAAEHAEILAERIRDTVNQPFLLQGNSHYFSTSIGISIYPDSTEQPATIIQQADTAMYKAKEGGRNSISFFRPSMQEMADKRLVLEKEIRGALKGNNFILFYQPQVNQDGDIVSAEALIRWQHPEKGMISPADFIPVAEDTQLILPIGQWVIEEACRQIKRWDDSNQFIEHIAVNVSSRQFRQVDFIDQVKAALSDADISASRLMVELTEGIVIDNIEDTIAKMRALKKMGVEVSIDDFGTGYSSLSYLKQLPLTQLKIDQSFVRDITIDPNDAVIVETIINMALNMGLNVIAEGVETQEQMYFLQDKGCFNFQGYFFGRPVPADEFCFKNKSAVIMGKEVEEI